MDWLVVDGVRPWDGRYEFDLVGRPLTIREWGWIRRFSSYLPLNVDEGWRGGDRELFAVFAVIALYRAGRIQPEDAAGLFDRLADSPGTAVRLELTTDDEEEGDASPPAGSSEGSTNGSGHSSRTSSDPSTAPGGIPGLATSESARVTSPT